MKNTNYLLLGTFVIVGSILMVAGVILFASARLGREAVAMETYFTESVTGLDVGSPVRFRGVKIGEVRRIAEVGEKYSTRQAYVLVEVGITSGRFSGKPADVINRELAAAIDQGLRVFIATQGLTGIAYIETDIFADDKFEPLPIDWEPEVPYVPSAPSKIKNLGDSLDQVLANLRDADTAGLVASARDTLDELRGGLSALKTAELAVQAGETLDSIRNLADESRAAITSLVQRANGTLEKLDATLSSEGLTATIDNLESASAETVDAVADLREVLGRAGTLVDEGRELLRRPRRDLDLVLANLRQISRSLANLSGVLERYPSLLLFGEKPKPTQRGK